MNKLLEIILTFGLYGVQEACCPQLIPFFSAFMRHCVFFATIRHFLHSLSSLLCFLWCFRSDASHILSLVFYLPLFFFLISVTVSGLSLLLLCAPTTTNPTASQNPPNQSAHVDMPTVTYDVDPLDLDAEELPESQGDPRSPKGMSGSVTSPQANTHRLPFFKKVTLGWDWSLGFRERGSGGSWMLLALANTPPSLPPPTCLHLPHCPSAHNSSKMPPLTPHSCLKLE